MAIIQTQEVHKIYPNGTIGLAGLSISIEPGEMVGVLGSSGAGKTTLFRMLNGTLRPSRGRLSVLGQELSGRVTPSELRRLRSGIALVNQNHNVIPPLSVLQNVLIGRLGQTNTLSALAGFFRVAKTDFERATEAIALVGLADKLYQRAEDLSGGQQQRVAIARSLMQGPQLLLADEPIASVDMRNATMLLDLFRRLNQELGITVVMNLHQLDFAIRYCPRILVLKAGRLAFDGRPEDLKDFDIYDEHNSSLPTGEKDLPPEAALLAEAEMGELILKRDFSGND